MKDALPPGLLIAGTGSSAGKTVAALGLIRALRALGLDVRAAKTGPDFIDAAFLAAASGAPAANLDAWMCRPGDRGRPRAVPAGLARLRRRLLAPAAGGKADIFVVEGAMGLYDGGPAGAGGAAQLAKVLDLPVLLVLNVRGMGQSVAALAEGFLRHEPAGGRPRFLGLICTHSGGAGHERLLREALDPVLRREGVPLCGFLPRAGAPRIASRHLGLVEAGEALAGLDLDGLGRWFAGHCDVAGILRALAVSLPQPRPVPAPPVPGPHPAFFSWRWPRRNAGRLRIGIARDAAFSFCYADLPALLAGLGAEPVFFSPLADAAPPEGCAGLYFPGGYPELHAEALAANAPMLAALRALAAQGLPVYGECGGYIYLMRELVVDGRRHRLAGLLPHACHMGERLAALGYREATPLPGWLPEGGENEKAPLVVRGHEFHYARLDGPEPPPTCAPLWRVADAAGEPRGHEGCRKGRVAGSWLHLYPEGSRRFWRAWLRLARAASGSATSPSVPGPRPEAPCP